MGLIFQFLHINHQTFQIDFNRHLLTPLHSCFELNYHPSGPLKSCHSKYFRTTLNSSHYYHHQWEYHHLSNNLRLFLFAHLNLKYSLIRLELQFLIYFFRRYSYWLIRYLGTCATRIKH